MPEPFERLLDAACHGGEWAWSRLYGEYAPSVRGYLRAQGAHDPDDLLGEVWLQVARSIHSFEGDENGFRSWLFVIAHHRLIDEWRRRKRRPEDPIDYAGGGGRIEDSAESRVLDGVDFGFMELIAPLTDDQRTVVLLRFGADLSVRAVAEAMDRSEGAVKVLQNRAIRRLRENDFDRVTKPESGTVA